MAPGIACYRMWSSRLIAVYVLGVMVSAGLLSLGPRDFTRTGIVVYSLLWFVWLPFAVLVATWEMMDR